MTINDIHDYLWYEVYQVGDKLDDLFDGLCKEHQCDKKYIYELSYKKTAIDEVIDRLRYTLSLYYEDAYDDMVLTYDILYDMSQTALAFSDFMCDAANSVADPASKIFAICSDVAKSTFEYLYLATGGYAREDGYLYI